MKKQETDQLRFDFGGNAKFVFGLDSSTVFFGDKEISSCISRVEMDLKVGEVARAKVHVLPGKIDVNHPLAEFVFPAEERVAELEAGMNNAVVDLQLAVGSKGGARIRFVRSALEILVKALEGTE